ncbi:hypothetical protein OS187_09495 [Xanthomonadaceae bacterium JHOS43]|nr:hypothetical protein [Xanthomonadaceae bacterium JHOS43]
MKKNSLTTAIIAGVAGVAGLAGVAHAVNLNADGIGQVLLYPYYTTNGGNTTLIQVVNTSDVGKAVKVRFLESLNSKEVLDFNLYMSPYDVWTANIHENAEGKVGIVTPDKSCIVPNRVMPDAEGNVRFTEFLDFEFGYWRPDRLGLTASANNISRKAQGHIEVIEMGDLYGFAHRYALHGTHGGEWRPENCGWFQAQWFTPGSAANPTWLYQSGSSNAADGNNFGRAQSYVASPGSVYWSDGPMPELVTGEDRRRPGAGGLFGSAYIVNVADGTAFSYNAEALNGFLTIDERDTDFLEDTNLHHAPGTVYPALWQAANYYDIATESYWSTSTVFDALGNALTFAFQRAAIDPTAPTAVGLPSPDAVSAVLSARYIMNEYAVNGFSSATSDWVVTFPTKQLHTYRPRTGPCSQPTGTRPFSCAQGAGRNGAVGDNIFDGYWPEEYELSYWDREELEPFTPPNPGDVSPLPPPGQQQVFAFGAEANVLTFYTEDTTAETVLSAPLGVAGGGYTFPLEAAFESGWARIGFQKQYMNVPAQDVVPGAETGAWRINGLPVIGFWAAKHVNAFAGPDITAYYNLIHRHRVTRDIAVDTQTAP